VRLTELPERCPHRLAVAATVAGRLIGEVRERARPDWIVVAGDVNSTLACALVGTKLCIPVVHLEAGLRSGDRRMPEEINRLATDAIADVLWTPSADADANLLRENVPAEKIDRVGNFMIDSYEMLRDTIAAAKVVERFALPPRRYAVVTLHRPVNVDSSDALDSLITQLVSASRTLPIVFAVHPRTRKRLHEFGLMARLENCESIRLTVRYTSGVCRVESTRWPVSAAMSAISMVSGSRISPSRMTSGSWRSAARRADENVGVSSPTSRWLIELLSSSWRNSMGSSMVTICKADVRFS